MCAYSPRFDIRTIPRQKNLTELRRILPTCKPSDMTDLLKLLFPSSFREGQKEVVDYILKSNAHREPCLLLTQCIVGPFWGMSQFATPEQVDHEILDLLLKKLHVYHHPITQDEVFRHLLTIPTQPRSMMMKVLLHHPDFQHYNRFRNATLLPLLEAHRMDKTALFDECWSVVQHTIKPHEMVCVMHQIQEERFSFNFLPSAFRSMDHWLEVMTHQDPAWQSTFIGLWEEHQAKSSSNRKVLMVELEQWIDHLTLTRRTQPHAKPPSPARKM